MSVGYIYSLSDPRDGRVRYIGKTVNARAREIEHRKGRWHTYCSRWVRLLRRSGLSPRFQVLEIVSDGRRAGERERWWIALGRLSGWPLTNLTDGGEGTLGRRLSLQTKLKISQATRGKKHRPHSPETRAKIGRASSGRQHSAMTRQQLRIRALGRKVSVETRAKQRAAHKGRHLSDEHKSKIGLAHRGKPESLEAIERNRAVHNTPQAIESARAAGKESKGRRASMETRAKMSATRRGRKQSPEHIAARVDARKARGWWKRERE